MENEIDNHSKEMEKRYEDAKRVIAGKGFEEAEVLRMALNAKEALLNKVRKNLTKMSTFDQNLTFCP